MSEPVHGEAMRLQLALADVRRRHGVAIPDPPPLPLLPAVDHDVIIEGSATVPDRRDHHCMRVRGWALTWPRQLPPLLVSHDAAVPAGEILELWYSERGALQVRARVTHRAAARYQGLSIGAVVEKWELRHVEDPCRFEGVVTQGVLTELSLTPRPTAACALIHTRLHAPPQPSFHELMARRVACCIDLVDVVRALATAPAVASASAPEVGRRRSDFRELVERMNANAELRA
jgi:hypothetical protein